MTGESMAERRARKLEPDWARTHDDLRDGLAKLGSHDGVAAFGAMLEEYGQTDWGQKSVSPFVAFMGSVTEGMTTALADIGADPARLSTVHVVPTMRDDMSAEMLPFADGSGLVVVSNTILSLCMLYSQSVGVAMSNLAAGGRLRRLWKAFSAARKGAAGVDVPILSGLLRYHNVNQRVYGLAAKLELRIPPEAEANVALVLMQSARFVIGHELAHHVLGHDSAPSGFFPGEHLPVCSDDQQRELAADLTAHLAVVRASEAEFAGTEAAQAAGALALLGGLVAMLAVHSAERALFVRRGVSHPPALHRANLLLSQVDKNTRAFVEMFLPSLLAATEASSVFAEGVDVFDGPRVLASPLVHTPQPMAYLQTIGALDAIQCLSRDRAVEALEQEAREIGAGARLAAAGNAAGALREWAVSDETVLRFVDPRQPLTFHAVVLGVRDGLTTLGLAEDARLAISVVAAGLVASALAT